MATEWTPGSCSVMQSNAVSWLGMAPLYPRCMIDHARCVSCVSMIFYVHFWCCARHGMMRQRNPKRSLYGCSLSFLFWKVNESHIAGDWKNYQGHPPEIKKPCRKIEAGQDCKHSLSHATMPLNTKHTHTHTHQSWTFRQDAFLTGCRTKGPCTQANPGSLLHKQHACHWIANRSTGIPLHSDEVLRKALSWRMDVVTANHWVTF